MVSVGRIVKSQGNKGEVRLKLYSGHFVKPFFQKVYLQKKGVREEFQVESIRPYKNNHILKLKTVDSLTEAKEVAGLEIAVPEEWLRPLSEGDYYLFQIIGCSVYTRDRRKIGEVKDFLFIENNDLLIVESAGEEILIPFTESICLVLDPEKKEIIIEPPEGLLELNEI